MKVSFEVDEISPEVLKSTSLAGIISSVKETEIDVVFHDPKGFLKDAVIHYFWFINTVNYGQTPTVSVIVQLCRDCIFCLLQGHFEYNFTLPGDYDVEVTAIAYFNAGINLQHSNSRLIGINLATTKKSCRAQFNPGTDQPERCGQG